MTRYAEISARLAELGRERGRLVGKKATPGAVLTSEEEDRLEALGKDLTVARQQVLASLKELEQEFKRLEGERRDAYTERNIDEIERLRETLRNLGEGVVLVHYFMGEERLRILVTTPDIQIARDAPVKASGLNRLIHAYREVLQDPRKPAFEAGTELYRLLIGPISTDLKQAGTQTLMVSLDGALRYLPLSALYDGQHYLVERYRVVVFTDAATHSLKDVPADAWRVAGLGLSHAVEGFRPLATPYLRSSKASCGVTTPRMRTASCLA
ncbi:MAG: CHAT domain-containing protein [Gammaproteobacteria bacterium]